VTEYHTAERTATTPLHVSTTPHLAYLLVLLALLAADIATTVWFTGLGLPDLNPHIAPIAGSVAAQVAYKAPFALLLVGSTALLATACDRLRSGAGKYPWLAVAGIYAVPVAWNLVVIAGHTGFHVVPAVVYAPVAVVCAVGVWRAAHPRPEALTMPANHPNPRPAGPPSTSPPIASPRPGGANMPGPRRPAPLRPLTLLAILLLMTCVVGPAASAEILIDTEYSDYFAKVATVTGSGSPVYTAPANGIIMSTPLSSPEFNSMFAQIPVAGLVTNYDSLPTTGQANVKWHKSSQSGTTGAFYMSGTYGYFKYTAGGANYLQIWAEFDDPVSKLTGPTYLKCVLDSGESIVWPKIRMVEGPYNYGPQPLYDGLVTDTSGIKATFATSRLDGGNYLFCLGGAGVTVHPVLSGTWKNGLRIETLSGNVPRVQIDITKNYDGYLGTSDHYVMFGETVYSAIGGTSDAQYIIPESEYPISVSIYNAQNDKWYNSTYGEAAPGEDAPVTVYVQNSQTGALLADANLSILAAAGGTETEIVNATLPGGTGTYSLEKADYLKYHASATADGYTLLSPILFGVPENGTTIVLWMAPDAPPDVPTEPEKSMLYGYVQTQGSQQPIAAATVSLDGYGSTTTSSTGFYLFNNITPGGPYTLSASAPLHDALSEPVTVDSAPTPHNLALKGHFMLTVTIKDGDDLTNLHNSTISLSDGQESTQNPATFTADYGPYTITATAGGYYPQTQSAYLDKPGTTTATVLLTAKPEPVPPPEMPNYPPHNVRFLCIDEYNRPLQNVTLRAVYQESTNPVDWFTSWLGLSPSVNINSTTLEGTTGLDGSVIFLMVESVQYRMTVTAPAPLNMTKTFDLYPKEDEITIRFVTSARPDLSTMPTYDLTATETDPSSVQLALSYHDTTNATTSLTFNVYDHATGDVINTQTFDASSFPGTVSPTYDVTNTNGAMYRFGFTAQNSAHGEISQYKGITLKGDNLLVDLGFEDRTLYQWLAVLLLFLFAGAFSGTNVKQGAILVPLFGGGLFWFIGWLPITLGATISAIGFLGVLVYMRKSEWKVRA